MIKCVLESYLQKRSLVLDFSLILYFLNAFPNFIRFMENSIALAKPKLTAAEKKIIALVVDGLPSENSRRAYARHLQEFFAWHASENRPELNKALIQRYVKSLRAQKLSSSTINQKLSAIRKLATEAEDNNLIDSPTGFALSKACHFAGGGQEIGYRKRTLRIGSTRQT